MASELRIQHDATGRTVKATVRRATDNQIWDTSGTPAFEAYNTASIANYGITCTEEGTASQSYKGTFPTGITTPGLYFVDYFECVGGSLAEGDLCIGTQAIEWDGSAPISLYSRLAPTVAGRTVDVSAGGEVGLDFANIGSPTTTVNLSGTTIKTATDVETDTADIQSRLPAALGANGNIKADVRDYNGTAGTFSGGRPEVNTTHAAGTAWASGAITAASIATGAITAAKFGAGAIDAAAIADGAIDAATFAAGAITATVIADGAIDAATFAAGAITATVIADNAITAAKIADGAIDAATFAAGAINAAAIADGAIDAATFAADVDAEFLSYIVDDATRIDASALNTATGTTIPAIVADTNELQTDWANGGRLDLILDARASQTSVDTIDGIVDAILVDTGTTLDGKIDTIDGVVDAILVDTAEIGAAGAGLSAIPWNAAWDAEVQSEATDALNAYDPPTRAELTTDTDSILSKLLKYVQLMLRKDAAIAIDNSTEVTAINANGGSGAGGFLSTTDSQEAIRDRGDAAWLTATSVAIGTGGITTSSFASGAIDAAALGNDCITAAKIAADAIGSSELAASAVTEIQSGLSTLDAAGIRTAVGLGSANLDTQLSGIDGKIDTIDANVDSVLADTGTDGVAIADGSITAAKIADNAIDAGAIATGAITSAKFASGAITSTVLAADCIGASQIAADAIGSSELAATAVAEIQSGLSTLDAAGIRTAVGMASANLDTQLSTIDGNVDSILDDTGTAGVVVASASKTGYALASTGLDSISTTAPSGVASNFREMVVQVWRRFFKKTTKTATELKTYADNGSTIVTTQVVSDDGTTQTQGPAT